MDFLMASLITFQLPKAEIYSLNSLNARKSSFLTLVHVLLNLSTGGDCSPRRICVNVAKFEN